MLLALDTETSGLTWDDSPFLMSYAMIGPLRGVVMSGFVDLWDKPEYVLPVDARNTYIFHNAKFDLRMLIKAGVLRRGDIKLDSFHDTQILAQLIDENRSLKLKDLAESVLGLTTDEAQALKAAKRKYKVTGVNKGRYDWLPRELLIPYAIKDAEFTLALFNNLYPELPESCKPLYDRERQLLLDVLDMESSGLGVDTAYAESMRKHLNSEILKTLNCITQMAGVEDFNPGSTKQLSDALLDRGYDLPLTEKGNPKTDSATLAKLDSPFAEQVLAYRKLTKLQNTYIIPVLEEGKSGVLHPNFNLSGAKTGRFSSSKARE